MACEAITLWLCLGPSTACSMACSSAMSCTGKRFNSESFHRKEQANNSREEHAAYLENPWIMRGVASVSLLQTTQRKASKKARATDERQCGTSSVRCIQSIYLVSDSKRQVPRPSASIRVLHFYCTFQELHQVLCTKHLQELLCLSKQNANSS